MAAFQADSDSELRKLPLMTMEARLDSQREKNGTVTVSGSLFAMLGLSHEPPILIGSKPANSIFDRIKMKICPKLSQN